MESSMMEVLDKKKKNLLEEHDYQEKIRVLSFNRRLEWFVDNKKFMSQNEKWDAFYDICEDNPGYSSERIMQMINNLIRRKGLAYDQ